MLELPAQIHESARGLPPAAGGAMGGRTVYLETFGCQMNELDSELVRGHLTALGYHFVDRADLANIVLYNTCSVRLQAEQKVNSRVGIDGKRKKGGDNFILGVIGCMAEREGTAMLRRFPQIDLMCGPGELDKLPMLIDNAFKTRLSQESEKPWHGNATALQSQNSRIALQGNTNRRSATLAAAGDNLEMLDLSRAFDPDKAAAGGKSAYVRITRGCNKFCTYCVVPFTRGAEVHRPPDSIIDECKKLADQGVIEITLLGQTVNHYAYTHGAAVSMNGAELPQVGPVVKARLPAGGLKSACRKSTTFADLLDRIHDEVPAIQRLRFVTSFPRDFGDDILHVMAASPRICKYLHVPAQSGSNRILKLMNRGYTVEQYLDFIDRARTIIPNISIAGDIIVGFPTETDEDFEMTKDLLRTVRFKNNFIFKYSPRPGTVAIDRFAAHDEVPDDVKRRRNNELLALQSQISAEVHAEYVGRVVDVFVEKIGGKSSATRLAAAPTPRPPHAAGNGIALTISAVAERAKPQAAAVQETCVQMSGRTEGDLIVVFDVPALPQLPQRADDLLGRIVPVRITSSAPLLLRGERFGGKAVIK